MGIFRPSAVTVFGYGGAMLPETFSENDIDDLNQLPVIRTDSKILFYAQGPTSWSYNEKPKNTTMNKTHILPQDIIS